MNVCSPEPVCKDRSALPLPASASLLFDAATAHCSYTDPPQQSLAVLSQISVDLKDKSLKRDTERLDL